MKVVLSKASVAAAVVSKHAELVGLGFVMENIIDFPRFLFDVNLTAASG